MASGCLGYMRCWTLLVGLGFCAFVPGGRATPAQTAEGAMDRFRQVDAIRTKDHAGFVDGLGGLHRDEDGLKADEKRYLRFLDGWEANYEGRYAQAEAAFRDVMAIADDDMLGTRATAMLMNNLTGQGKYAEAYAMASRAVDTLPVVTDPEARFSLLANLSQMLTFAGQPELGLKYAEMMLKATPAGQSPCQAMVQKVTALEGARELTDRSPELLNTIDICKADRQPIFADTMSLILVDRLFAEHKLDQALATVERIEPAIQTSRYFPHIIDLASQRARIYEAMGKPEEARKAALQTVALNHPGDVNEALRIAYRVLYSIDKAQGNDAGALDYYERYVIQDQGYLRDANVRNAAYEAASQHFRAEKLETEGLSKENRILRLQQALDAKAVETSRLYMVVMSLVLLSIVFWMVRIKRSQLRFKWLSSCDGLTGIFHHQHFVGEAERALRVLEKRGGEGCLVFLDLDHFKQVNDAHGHAVGDAVLKHAVAVFKGQLRKADLLGRLGGEEFGMLLMDTPRLQGSVVAERVRQALESSPLVVEGVVVAFSVSIGLACTDTTGYGLQDLCRAADAALYQAKHLGRNRVVVDGDEISGRLRVSSPH
ncbi:GGDEF domain-containing protein [Luteibacter yeojuensis]|uniref:diguanylate cyclase n=1 Tax=Luteibacter yeojuensis TaxID=345309 RepID=A0A7X5QRJ3_9GAMM|nr:GGDEF domain-containing protein [Luteibacter yeojuensis]NID14091.1 diguanylate cyclase [Luteibacter yeojuensis]